VTDSDPREETDVVASRAITAALIATALVGSAAVLVVEIIAGRILAPYVGMSVYTWTAIISTVLAGLTIGNWVGGMLASGEPTKDFVRLGAALILAALVTAGVLVLARPVAEFVLGNTQSAVIAVLGLSLGLFFLPALFGGIPSPIIARAMVTHHRSAEGKALGWVFASGSAGAIAGSAFSGFVLIPYFGSAFSTLIAAGSLGVLGGVWLLFAQKQLIAIASLAMVAAVSTGAATVWKSVCDRETATFCIRVVSFDGGDVEQSDVRGLVLDHLVHGVNMRDEPGALLSPYVAQIDRAARVLLPSARSAFFVGGGAYTLPRAWSRVLAVTVAEIEPAVTDIARDRLWVDTSAMTIMHQDARVALKSLSDASVDLIIGDAFKDVAAPFHLTTREFAILAQSKLRADGLYFLNIVDREPNPDAMHAVAATLNTIFPHIAIWRDEAVGIGTARHTYVIAAANAPFAPALLSRAADDGWQPYRIDEDVLHTAFILTDDHAPVEHLLGLVSDGLN